MLSNKQFLFIIGAPRSGTTWLQVMVGSHPDVCTTVELSVFNRYTTPWLRTFEREKAHMDEGRWSQGLPFLWSREELLDFLGEFVERVYTRVLEKNPSATHILDKQPLYSGFVREIDELLPNARFIHLLRDGRDVAVSMRAAREQIGFGPQTMADCAQHWVDQVRAACVAREFGDRYLEVRYRDLLEECEPKMQEVFEFCGLPATGEQVNEIVEAHRFEQLRARRQCGDPSVDVHPAHYRKGKRGSWCEEMSPKERAEFQSIAGQLLIELGYVEDASWTREGRQGPPVDLSPLIEKAKGAGRRLQRAVAALAGS